MSRFAKENDGTTSRSSPIANLFGLTVSSSEEDSDGEQEFGKPVATPKTAQQIAADMKAKTIVKPEAKTVEQFERGTVPRHSEQTET